MKQRKNQKLKQKRRQQRARNRKRHDEANMEKARRAVDHFVAQGATLDQIESWLSQREMQRLTQSN